MRLSLVFEAFLARTAVGVLVALLPLWAMRAAERHLRFQVLLAVVLAAGAAALYGEALGPLHPDWPRGGAAFLALEGGMPGFLVLLGVLGLLANLLYGTFRRRAGRAALALAVLAGVGVAIGSARLGPAGAADPGAAPLAVLSANALLGGLVMGSILNAMILGHFYLMIRGLPLQALRRAGFTVAVALLLRMGLFGAVLLGWEGAADTLLGPEAVWTAWRVAFGFLGPLVLLLMVKDTVRLRHTQAATGLLYVATGFALMGELAAVYLEVQAGIPV